MKLFGFLVLVALCILSLRGVRWAYLSYVLLGLLYFPVKAGFRFDPQPCELTPTISLAIHSFTNHGHIVLFTIFFVMTIAQFRTSYKLAFTWATVIVIAMGALVEIMQAVTNTGHCRLRDLIPDSVGAFLGSIIVWLWNGIRSRKGRFTATSE